MKSVKSLLDDLMGRDRDSVPTKSSSPAASSSSAPGQRRGSMPLTDPRLCKHFLCGFCPYKLLSNTKNDIGQCTLLHDEECQAYFLSLGATRKRELRFEEDLFAFLEDVVEKIDKKGRERLVEQEKYIPDEVAEKLALLSAQLPEMVAEVERLGEEGKVTEAQTAMAKMEEITREKERLEAAFGRSIAPEKRMNICDVCGALLVIGDTPQRIAAHMEGKQHVGFAKIREWLAEYKKTHLETVKSSSHHHSDRDRDRDRNRDRDRDKERGRDRRPVFDRNRRPREDYYDHADNDDDDEMIKRSRRV